MKKPYLIQIPFEQANAEDIWYRHKTWDKNDYSKFQFERAYPELSHDGYLFFKENKDKLIEFYLNDGETDKGRTFQDILNYDYVQLENDHNYIQWIFPTKDKSQFNLTAPILTPETISVLRESADFQKKFELITNKMVEFWGWETECGELFRAYFRLVFEKNDHNFLRVTRFIKSYLCLSTGQLFAGDAKSAILQSALDDSRISKITLVHWINALEGK